MNLTRQQYVMIALLLFGAFMVVLNATLLTPTLPVIMSDLGVEATTVQWLTSGYSLVEAIIVPLTAFFLGRFTTRKLYIGGIGLFAIGSLVAALSPSFAFLLLGRMIQASAAGLIMSMVFSVIVLMIPKEKRGMAMGLVGLVISFAPAIGPSLGGVLADSIGWRALFVVVASIAMILVILSIFVMKNFEGFARGAFDLLSVIMSTIGLATLLYGLSTFSSTENHLITLAFVACGLLFVVLFVRRQNQLEEPLLRIEVLKSRRYRTAACTVFILQAVLVGTGVLFPMYLQNVLGTTATVSGLVTLPGAIIGAICGVISGRLFDKFGIRGLALFGSLVMLAAGVGMFFFSESTPLIVVIVINAFVVTGLQFITTPLNTWGVNSLDNKLVQHATAVTNTLNQVGASMGTALIISVSAYGNMIAPDAVGTSLIMAGQHLSFLVIVVLLIAVFLIILLNARDKASDADPRMVSTEVNDALPKDQRNWLVRDVMNPEPLSIGDGATVAEVVAKLSAHQTSGLVVVNNDGEPVGFVTDGDIMNGIAREEKAFSDGINFIVLLDDENMQEHVTEFLAKNVMNVATKKIITVDANYRLESACKVLAERRIKKLPVLSDGKLVGMLSRRNIVNAMAKVNRLV
ncbi:MAG: MDR family MFS transporter [Coriobacteriia bacterium]|nr:MDR family MFS transporter [Coriobacteriia bacterium]